MTLGGFMVLALIAWGGWWFYKNVMSSSGSSSGGSSSTPEPAPLRVIEMPRDAHDAVERFAHLASEIRGYIMRQGSYDPYFHAISCTLKYGTDDESGTIDIWMDFDFSLDWLIEDLGYRLGDGFVIEGTEVHYRSGNISNLRKWAGGDWLWNQTSEDVKRAGYKVFADAVVATIQNNCSGTYARHAAADDSGVFVLIKFHG